MARLSSSIFFLVMVTTLIVLGVLEASGGHPHTKKRSKSHLKRKLEEKFTQTMAGVASLPCDEPQMRSFWSANLLSNTTTRTRTASEQVLPAWTVLHRCEDSGCCGGGSTCAPTPDAIEKVKLVFQIKDNIDNTSELVVVDGQNHTHCTCAKIGEDALMTETPKDWFHVDEER